MMEEFADLDFVEFDDDYDPSLDDDGLDDEPLSTYMSGRHRALMDGEAVPSIPTMYQQLAMTWRGDQWAMREDMLRPQI